MLRISIIGSLDIEEIGDVVSVSMDGRIQGGSKLCETLDSASSQDITHTKCNNSTIIGLRYYAATVNWAVGL